MTTFQIYFDGGTMYSPNRNATFKNRIQAGLDGNGYGSWEVRWNGFTKTASRVPFLAAQVGQYVTNNVAEYLALIRALEWIQTVKDKGQYQIEIFGDSQFVLKTFTGEFKVKQPHLKPLQKLARELVNGFAGFKCQWQKRHHNVQRFGH